MSAINFTIRVSYLSCCVAVFGALVAALARAADCTVDSSLLPPSTEEQNLMNLINTYRPAANKLVWSNTLSKAAVWIARDNGTRSLEASDIDSLGRDVWARLNDCGYPLGLQAAEDTIGNQVYMFGDGTTLSAWQTDGAMWDNLVNIRYTHVGIAQVYNAFSPYKWHWAVVVGTDGTVPPPNLNQAPSPNAGTDKSVTCVPGTGCAGVVTLAATITDDGLPVGSTLSTKWAMATGPTPLKFGNSMDVNTYALLERSGTYILRLIGDDGDKFSYDYMTVVYSTSAAGSNAAPVVNAGPDQTITLPSSANLSGTVTDDGLPNGTLTKAWSKVSGPGIVTFANPNLPATTASFSTSGSYVLRLTGNDGALSASDDVMITVNAAPSINTTPAAPRRLRFR